MAESQNQTLNTIFQIEARCAHGSIAFQSSLADVEVTSPLLVKDPATPVVLWACKLQSAGIRI